jgi:hypothetical protein
VRCRRDRPRVPAPRVRIPGERPSRPPSYDRRRAHRRATGGGTDGKPR